MNEGKNIHELDGNKTFPGTTSLSRTLRAAMMVLVGSANMASAGTDKSEPIITGAPLGSIKLKMTNEALKRFQLKLPNNTTLNADIASAQDGIDINEEKKMREDFVTASKSPLFRKEALGVLDALDLKETSLPIGATDADRKLLKAEQGKVALLVKQQAEKPKLIADFNKGIIDSKKWIVTPASKDSTLKGEVSVTGSGKVLNFILKGEKGRVETDIPMPDGWYTLHLNMDGKIIIWTKKPDGTDDRLEIDNKGESTKLVYLTPKSRLGVPLEKLSSQSTINGISLAEPQVDKDGKMIAQGSQ